MPSFRRFVKYMLFIGSIFFFLSSSTINAQTRGFGVGIVLGEPTGFTAKMWSSRTTAAVATIAWSTETDNHFHLQGDYLVHALNAIRIESTGLTPFIGIGALARFGDGDRVAVRVPVGLDYYIRSSGIEIFFELTPLMEISPDTEFDVAGGLGFRYFF